MKKNCLLYLLLAALVVAGGCGGASRQAHTNTNNLNQNQPPTPEDSAETVRVVVYREIEGKEQVAVPPDTVFKSGDGVRLGVSTAEPGWLTVVMKGSSGKAGQLFPDQRVNGGKHDVVAQQQLMIPTLERVFRFDKQAGVETVYVVFWPKTQNPLNQELFSANAETQVAYLENLTKDNQPFARISGGALVRVVRLQHK